jgi:CMP-N-acetylneuraminic acid synthetase
MRVLGLIPARGGSKGIPRKNVRVLGDRPLIAWTIDAAARSAALDRLVVSTDDPEVAEVARRCGAEVPFLRAAHLAADDTPTLPVVVDVLDRLEAEGDAFDAVCLLQPTSPFRAEGLIDRCVERLAATGADSVVTMKRLPAEHHPAWAYVEGDGGTLHLASGSTEPPPRRQELSPAWCREGSVYVTRVPAVRAGSLYGERLVGVEVDADATVNLDTEADWAEAAERVAVRAPVPSAAGERSAS